MLGVLSSIINTIMINVIFRRFNNNAKKNSIYMRNHMMSKSAFCPLLKMVNAILVPFGARLYICSIS